MLLGSSGTASTVRPSARGQAPGLGFVMSLENAHRRPEVPFGLVGVEVAIPEVPCLRALPPHLWVNLFGRLVEPLVSLGTLI